MGILFASVVALSIFEGEFRLKQTNKQKKKNKQTSHGILAYARMTYLSLIWFIYKIGVIIVLIL